MCSRLQGTQNGGQCRTKHGQPFWFAKEYRVELDPLFVQTEVGESAKSLSFHQRCIKETEDESLPAVDLLVSLTGIPACPFDKLFSNFACSGQVLVYDRQLVWVLVH